MTANDRASERAGLLRWYRANARALPWRETRDPYAIWVSEVMLQQTRVETVIPYYTRFLERFPDTKALAAASEDEVLSLWSGLGYYRRARWLQRGVREVVEHYGGEVPQSAEARRALPGVGRYTAGAIGSIAFGLEEPIVDGNVARVLSRLRGIATPLGQASTMAALWSEAEALVRGESPGDLNQALMELGARVCTPRAPLCGSCPLERACVARAQGSQEALPVRPPSRVVPEIRQVAVFASRDESIVMVRSNGGAFSGLWAVPMADGAGARAARAAAAASGLRRGRLAKAGEVLHVLTHRRLRVEVFVHTGFTWRSESGARLVATHEQTKLGISKLTRRVIACARALLDPG